MIIDRPLATLNSSTKIRDASAGPTAWRQLARKVHNVRADSSALADRSAAFWDTTGYLAWSGPPVGTRSLLASSEAALLDRLMDFGSGGRADARPAV